MIIFKYSKSKNHRNNDFNRLFPPYFIYNPKQIELSFNSFYLAGITKNNIYLGNITAPAFLLKLNYDLTDTSHLILKVPSRIEIASNAIRVCVDSPDIYMMEGISPKVLHGALNDLNLTDSYYNGVRFNTSSIISRSSFVLRTYDQVLERNILAKSTIQPKKTERFPNILTKRGDGIFSIDGNLTMDQYTRQLVYVYYYRNEYICLDTNLNIISKGKTIDSVHTPQIKLSKIFSEETTTFSAPPLTVNKTSCVDSGFLFVNSSLKAKNEDEFSFENNSVIDIYSLKNDEYQYSFYIPDHHHIKMKSFRVLNHQLIALYDHSLFTFSIHF